MAKRPLKRKPKQSPRRDPAATYSVLLDVMRALAAERQLDDLLLKITQKASEVLDADRSTIFLVDEDKGELWSKVAQGADMKEIRVPLTAGIAGYVGRTGETLNIPDEIGRAHV